MWGANCVGCSSNRRLFHDSYWAIYTHNRISNCIPNLNRIKGNKRGQISTFEIKEDLLK